jgi:SAM-dependent methyltransferase
MSDSDLEHLHALRAEELGRVLHYFPPPGADVLEIGGGTGHQAQLLSERGYRVTSVDRRSSEYVGRRVFPIVDYDGVHIPAEDASFDCVFSSNVLEHVHDLAGLANDIQRVLRPSGVCVHVLPTSSWRIWSSLTHYPERARAAVRFAKRGGRRWQPSEGGDAPQSFLKRSLYPQRHGERGNALTEPWWFRRAFWIETFERQGFDVVTDEPLGLFYTGASLLSSTLPLELRSRAARVLGSATRVFVLRRAR